MPQHTDMGGRTKQPMLSTSEKLVLVRTITALLRKWRVSDEHALEILGGPPASVYDAWKRGSVDELQPDAVYRLSLLLKIHAFLRIRFRDPDRALVWVNRPNSIFGGRAPIEVMGRDIRSIERVLSYLIADQAPW